MILAHLKLWMDVKQVLRYPQRRILGKSTVVYLIGGVIMRRQPDSNAANCLCKQQQFWPESALKRFAPSSALFLPFKQS